MVMKKYFETIFINYIRMEIEVIIILNPHSSSSDILEVKAFSNFSWITKKHEASGINQTYQIRGNEKGECIKTKEATWTVGTIQVPALQFRSANTHQGC